MRFFFYFFSWQFEWSLSYLDFTCKLLLLFRCFENCLHHLTGIPTRVLQRTSSIKGANPQRMPLRANTGERLFGANHVSLLSFPQVLRRLNFSFKLERWFVQATKGPDLLFGGMELEIMERPQRTYLGNPLKKKNSRYSEQGITAFFVLVSTSELNWSRLCCDWHFSRGLLMWRCCPRCYRQTHT